MTAPLKVHVPTAAAPAGDWLEQLPAGLVDALYVHVPFCFHKCHYCDFYSITHQSPDRMSRFVDLLLREADEWQTTAARRGIEFRPQTIFFGGGTPSLLPLPQMQRLLAGLRDRFDLSNLREWTVEANPATVTPEYCRMLREAGVDRISFGAQSFDRAELHTLERHHQPEQVAHSLELARSAGFRRLNIDLIYAIPNQDLGSWNATLAAACALGTEHISAYGLTYEPNTPMAVKKRMGQVTGVEESLELEMMHTARRTFSDAGLQAYEISNYAHPGAECRHNLHYWNGGSYLGLGPSAASHMHGTRWRNRPHLGEWEARITNGRLPVIDLETLSPRRRAGELALLQLRLSSGIDYADFTARTGHDAHALYADTVARLANLGLLDADASGFRLTKKGLNVADGIAMEFLEC